VTGNELTPVVTYSGLTLLWISAIVTLYTGYDYFVPCAASDRGMSVKLLYFAWVRERVGRLRKSWIRRPASRQLQTS